MERIEELLKSGASADYGPHGWLPALPLHYYRAFAVWPDRIRDAWAVLWCRATAVQWPDQRQSPDDRPPVPQEGHRGY